MEWKNPKSVTCSGTKNFNHMPSSGITTPSQRPYSWFTYLIKWFYHFTLFLPCFLFCYQFKLWHMQYFSKLTTIIIVGNFLYVKIRSNALELINCSDWTQYSLFIWLDLSILKVIHSSKIMLNSERNTYVLYQTHRSYKKVGTICTI